MGEGERILIGKVAVAMLVIVTVRLKAYEDDTKFALRYISSLVPKFLDHHCTKWEGQPASYLNTWTAPVQAFRGMLWDGGLDIADPAWT